MFPKFSVIQALFWGFLLSFNQKTKPDQIKYREFPDGFKAWTKDRKFHREDGPAVIWPSGIEEWYYEGKRHRDDGPAFTRGEKTQQWWKRGKFVKEI